MFEAPRNEYALRAVEIAVACSLLVVALCPGARADTVYTYTGNPFDQFSAGAACPPLCSISVSFTLAEPLPDNLPFLTLVSPLSFSFTDGSTTITQANQSFMAFGLGTDSQGNIGAWEVEVSSGSSPANFLELSTSSFKGDSDDSTCKGLPCTIDFASIVDNPGKWTSSTTVPEPSSLLLFGPAFLGIISWRKRQWFVDRFLRA
jgi:hypothetical protein